MPQRRRPNLPPNAVTTGEEDHMSISTTVPTRVVRRSPNWITKYVRRAAAGDRDAWREIVEEFEGMLRAVARGHRLSEPDVADVTQTTWVRLAENLNRLKDPSRVGAWLATTARRECLRTLRASTRELPDADPPEPTLCDMPSLDADLLAAERDKELWSAFLRLPARDQALLRMLVADPQPSYADIGDALEMPIGSIGPTRGRALDRLRGELRRGHTALDRAA
jgi:RNA polymerase sigma factor (sigma-70 family)